MNFRQDIFGMGEVLECRDREGTVDYPEATGRFSMSAWIALRGAM